MAGFEVGIINLIADNLRDRYKNGFLILKEIIQNADDAASKIRRPVQLDFGFSNGFPNAEHPLLKGPGVFFLNNGSFSEQDARAVGSFAINSKATDKATIGKFGLGMKSVFHYCEAVFWLAQDDKVKKEEILNPWYGYAEDPRSQPFWDTFTLNDQDKIKEHLKDVFKNCNKEYKSYFLLWLPLRQKQHSNIDGQEVGSIIAEFPGDKLEEIDFLFESNRQNELANLLPFLRNITCIQCWKSDNFNVLRLQYAIRLEKGANRNSYPNISGKKLKPLSGKVKFGKIAFEDTLQFVGYEGQIEKLKQKFLKNDYWPGSYVRDKNGREQYEPDKAEGHCAVTFSKFYSKTTEGSLNIQWAVFLPIDKNQEKNINCKNNFVYTLTLHGYFFVDAGRVEIEGAVIKGDDPVSWPPTSENELRAVWNDTLLKKGTFLLLIPALQHFVQKIGAGKDERRNLCESLASSNFFCKYRKYICQKYQWVLRMHPTGSEWEKVKSEQKLLPLPATPQKIPNRPWETFPALSELENEFFFIQKGAPHLMKINMPQWDESSLLKILDLDSIQLFSNQGFINYFNLFFQDNAGIVSPFLKISSIQTKLINLVRKGFLHFGSQISKFTTGVQEIVSNIQPENRYVIKSNAHTIIHSLQKIEMDFLVLHKNFDYPQNSGIAKLNVDNALIFFKKLDQQLSDYENKNENKKIEECGEVISEVLKNLDRDVLLEILKHGKSYKIIKAYDCQLEKYSFFTIEELEYSSRQNILFLYSQGVTLKDRLGLSSKLQAVLSNEKIIVFNSDAAKLIFHATEHGIQQCMAKSCLKTLGINCKSLSSGNSRVDLIKAVSGVELKITDNEAIRGFRYLLHGNRTLFDDDCSLWIRGYQQHTVWSKLWEQLTENKKDNLLIDKDSVEDISEKKRKILGFCEINQQGILNDIRENGIDFIQVDTLTKEDRIEVLVAAQHDQDLWKKLPLHKTVSEGFISISNLSYMEPAFHYPDALLGQINIVQKSSDSRLSRFQNDPDYIQPLTDKVFISNLLEIPDSFQFSQFIMDALKRIDEIEFDLKKQLKEIKWLADNYNMPLCPADVICLPDINDEVNQLIVAEPGNFWQPESLSKEIQQHSYFDKLKEYFFSHKEDGLIKLALLLEQNSKYAVGDLTLNSNDFSSMLKILGTSSCTQYLPGWRILYVIFEKFGLDLCKQYILPALSNSIHNDKLLNLFDWLEQQHNGADGQRKDDVSICYLKYLKVFSRLQDARQLLSNINLLNQNDKWCSSKMLCHDTEGISPSYLLDSKQRDILSSLLPQQKRFHEKDEKNIANNEIPIKRDLEVELESMANDLLEFFSQWENLIQPEIIGCFLSMLGDDTRILQLSENFQGRHFVEWFRDKIPWKNNKHKDDDGREGWLYDLSYKEALSQFRFIIDLISADRVTVKSLVGQDIEVELNDEISSLIIGKSVYEPSQIYGIQFVRIRLRRLNGDQIDSDKFSKYLKTTAEYLLKNEYGQQNCDLTNLWDELNKSEQLDIRTALRLVMKHVPFYLDQLGVHKDKLISVIYNLWNESRYKIEEYYDKPEKSEKYKQEEEKNRQALQSLIENDSEVQKVVLESVRKKMRDFQYTEKSIPFELYQNADDAVVEQLEIDNYPENVDILEKINTGETNRFVMQKEGNTIRFMHWGRPVNSIGAGGFPGRKRGFHQDLEKMLILSSSNKSATHHLTGKFGLGFKSVLLVCDKPIFLSGRLGVKITAGLYPQQLSGYQSLYNLLSRFSNDMNNRKGTLIELQLKKGLNGNIFEQFIELSGVLTVFSKTIRCVNLIGFTAQQESIEWKPEIIESTSEIQLEMGNLLLKRNNSKLQVKALYFRHKSGGGLLIGLDSHGVMALPDNLPPVWIISPTREKGRLGFCINGNFEVDAGRARLAGESGKNTEEAKNIGQGIGNMLCSLFQKSVEDWHTVREQLGLLPDLSFYNFWESVWDTLTRTWFDPSEKQLDSEVLDVVSNLLGGDSGLGVLIKKEHALPNGLWNDEFKQLINPKAISYVLRGSLSEKEIFKPLSKWQLFKDKINPENVISAKIFPALGKILPGFTQKKDQWQSLRLSQVINWLQKNGYRVDVETATVFGEIITKEFLENLQKTDDGQKEFIEIVKQLKQLKFQTKNDSWYLSKHLLRTFSFGTDDELLRACFAPLGNVLTDLYIGTALKFFIICRGEMQAKVDTMVEWILQASSDMQKTGALKYLIKGELGDRVAYHLRDKMTKDSWLSGLNLQSSYFDEWSDNDIRELLFRKLSALSELERWQEEDNYYEQEDSVIQPGDVSKTLQNIYDWWQDNRSEYLQKYEEQTYPDYISANSLSEDDRSAWLTILMIGSFHTFGRAKPEQHRRFLSLCQKKGWWDIFIQEHPKRHSDKWMGVLYDYIEKQEGGSEFEYWMRLFPTIYKFALKLEDYIELFYSLEQQGENINVQQTMTSKTFSDFQGGGIAAAPIAKTLGMGVPFVLREMMRKDLFNSNEKYIVPYCYVPIGRVRNFFSTMGCNDLENDESHITKSKIIHDFLCKHLGDNKAEFNNSFDIPFQYVAGNLELQEELFV